MVLIVYSVIDVRTFHSFGFDVASRQKLQLSPIQGDFCGFKMGPCLGASSLIFNNNFISAGIYVCMYPCTAKIVALIFPSWWGCWVGENWAHSLGFPLCVYLFDNAVSLCHVYIWHRMNLSLFPQTHAACLLFLHPPPSRPPLASPSLCVSFSVSLYLCVLCLCGLPLSLSVGMSAFLSFLPSVCLPPPPCPPPPPHL